MRTEDINYAVSHLKRLTRIGRGPERGIDPFAQDGLKPKGPLNRFSATAKSEAALAFATLAGVTAYLLFKNRTDGVIWESISTGSRFKKRRLFTLFRTPEQVANRDFPELEERGIRSIRETNMRLLGIYYQEIRGLDTNDPETNIDRLVFKKNRLIPGLKNSALSTTP